MALAMIEELCWSARRYATEVRALVVESLSQQFSIATKKDNSPVTSVDIKIEDHIRYCIARDYPSHGIIGEERTGANPNPQAEFQWTLDPIDGTGNFAYGMITPATMIGVIFQGEPIVGVVAHHGLNLTYAASKGAGAFCNNQIIEPAKISSPLIFAGTRAMFARTGDQEIFDALIRQYPETQVFSDPFSQTQTVHGRIGAAVEFNLKIWDIVPMKVLMQEAGGIHRIVKKVRLDDNLMLYSSIFGHEMLVNRLCALLGFRDEYAIGTY